jgi:inorganic pyrophosphatase
MICDVFIEISKDSNIKYEYDKESGGIRLDRVLKSSMVYPENYGYIQNTLADDGDALDIILIADYPLVPGSFVKSRIIGVLDMEDEKGIDHKVIVVPDTCVDSTYEYVNDIDDLPQSRLNSFLKIINNSTKINGRLLIHIKIKMKRLQYIIIQSHYIIIQFVII